MTESELKEAYLERVAWRERQVLKYLRRPYKGNLIEPYSGFFYLSNSERLKATIAGYKPSDIICFRDLDSYRRFVFSLEPRLRSSTCRNGVLVEALEYHGVCIDMNATKEDIERLASECLCGIDRRTLTYLQGKYELSTRFIFEELKTSQVMKKVFVWLHDRQYNG